jgi:hypothetical protein
MEDFMKHYSVRLILLLAISVIFSACSNSLVTTFPSPDEVFVTTGDGNIQKPYTPIGQLYYIETGFRIPFPLLSLIPIKDVDPDIVLKTKVYSKVREMGGDALINMSMNWTPSTSGFLGLGASGGAVVIYGTVIKR